jgi:hypothetical protein
MQLLPLHEVAYQIKPGLPLAWGIRDENGKLLLARGHLVTDDAMLNALLARGMFVDMSEMRAALGASHASVRPKEGFFGRWRLTSGRLHTLLTTSPPDLRSALDEVVNVLMGLADRYPDKVLFQILRHDQTKLQSYGVSHSLHCAAVSCLIGKRMGWDESRRRVLVSAAMSMNLSMIELQGRLAVQAVPLTVDQRSAIQEHPVESAEMLRAAGVQDQEWLAAVEQHHEMVDGTGYPKRLTDINELAQALHYVDVFTAKLSARSSRVALAPNVAARDLFTGSAGHPLAAALVKEFGIYPPGCFVRLASGEIAIVIHRGKTVNTPVVACLTNAAGQAMMRPQRRETTDKANAIVTLVADADVMVRVPWETLYQDD